MNNEIAINGQMNFGQALIGLRTGSRVARSGWNGKGMWVSLTPGRMVHFEHLWSKHNAAYAHDYGIKGEVEVLPYITMKTADNKIVPWLASQTDILAEDWSIL